MSTDEEYLDSLLNSMKENSDVQMDADMDSLFREEKDLQEEKIDTDSEIETEKDFKEAASDDSEEWKASLDELLAAADDVVEEPALQKDNNDDGLSALLDTIDYDTEKDSMDDSFDDITEKTAIDDAAGSGNDINTAVDNMDVTQIMDGLGSSDDDLAAINDFLKNADDNEAKEDMMALLDSVKENGDSDETENKGLFGRNKKKKKSLFLSKKKKKNNEIEDVKNEEEMPVQEESVIREENLKEEKEKKSRGFWGHLVEVLLREDEETKNGKNLGENEEILKELEIEDQENTGKKKKKEKKKNKNKKTGRDSKEKETETKKKKKKRPEKEKKKKEKVEEPKEKPIKVLSPTALFVLIAFCATLIASVVLLSIFLPDYADKQNARNAFYAGDYNKVYELLYDKKLNQSDALLYNRANIVLQLQRRLDSYNFNRKTGKEAEAMDALLQGVVRYEELMSGETYGASDELMSIYQTILDHLNTDFGISEEEAIEINTYDSEAYTQKIYAIINGTDFGENKDADLIPEQPQDILPEEEDIISMELQ